jgi:hypothetical protein
VAAASAWLDERRLHFLRRSGPPALRR